jgi:RNA polymerase sigma-70 factor (ECF subfamily)
MPAVADPPTTHLVARVRAAQPGAAGELLNHTCERLRGLAGRMLGRYPVVGRWEETDDVLQNALLRLSRALRDVPPQSARHFYNLAALQIRRELLDLAAKHAGPHADATHHLSHRDEKVLTAAPAAEPADLEEWAALHQAVGELPEEEREVFNLLWYDGLDQERAAEVLGVSLRTLKRRWQAARLALSDKLGSN